MNCGKYKFRGYTQAAKVANRQNRDRHLRSRTLHKVEPYFCPLCGSYHVTGHNN